MAARHRPQPEESRDAAKRCILDLLSAVLVGLDSPGARAVRKVAAITQAQGLAPVWFSGLRSNWVGAAWCNSAAAVALDLDDGNRPARGHAGAAVISAAFAAGHRANASLEQILDAIIIGYEVGVSVGAARRHYANSGMWVGYGVVAALGALGDLPASALAQAFAITGVSAPNQFYAGAGPVYPSAEGNDVKEGIPWATLTAANAVLLAEVGMTGPERILDHDGHFSAGAILADLGERHHVRNTYFKLYTCCRHVHAPIDALLGLIEAHALDPQAIERIEVHAYSGALRISNRTEPTNAVEIQFSIPYCLGLAAYSGREALLPLRSDALGGADVSEFARRVSLHLDPALDARFPAETLARLVVWHRGERYESSPTAPRGEASDPLGWQALEEKFIASTRFVAAPAEQELILLAARRLRDGDLAALSALMENMQLTGRI